MGTTKFYKTLIMLLTFLLQHESCDCGIPECPKPEPLECNRELKHFYERLHVYSHVFNLSLVCDTKTDGGGWIVIQRRVNKYVPFDRIWKEYKNGFGSLCGDFWLGNENIHRISSTGRYELRIDMMFKNRHYYALYSNFAIDNEGHGYRLTYKSFINGNVTNMLRGHNDQQFSTPDRDNDLDRGNSCGRMYQAGWWYSHCNTVTANLNGGFNKNDVGRGVFWKSLTTAYDSLDSVEMKIRQI